jgi:8-oxo-dGTP pyrophosphatase MutT (NUDIX family)
MIVLDSKGRVLLVQHAYGDEGWGLPGGGPSRREALADTAVREVREETGIPCQVQQLLGIYDNFQEGKSDHVALFVGLATAQVDPSPVSPEILRAGYFPLSALPPGTSGGTRRRLAELSDNQGAYWGFW